MQRRGVAVWASTRGLRASECSAAATDQSHERRHHCCRSSPSAPLVFSRSESFSSDMRLARASPCGQIQVDVILKSRRHRCNPSGAGPVGFERPGSTETSLRRQRSRCGTPSGRKRRWHRTWQGGSVPITTTAVSPSAVRSVGHEQPVPPVLPGPMGHGGTEELEGERVRA